MSMIYNMDSTETSIFINKLNVYNGQMLWALSLHNPYWPSIVCDSYDSNMGDMKAADQLVCVRFCANKDKRCWVKRKNTFEFNGIESFNDEKKSKKSKLSKDEFETAFDAEENEEWRKAVIEGTLLMCKALEQRMAYFKIMIIHSLQENCKQPTSDLNNNWPHTQLSIICKDLNEEFDEELNLITQSINFINKNSRNSVLSSLSSHKPAKNSSNQRSVSGSPLIDKTPASIEEPTICRICKFSKDNQPELVECAGACGLRIHKTCGNETVNENFIDMTLPTTKSIEEKLKTSLHITDFLYCNECIGFVIRNMANKQPKPPHYTPIEANELVAPAKITTTLNYSKCACTPDDPCVLNCENRRLSVECDPNQCPCGSKCKNQSFQRQSYPNVDLKYLGIKGYGLLAAQLILHGTLVIEYVGEIIKKCEFVTRRNTKHTKNYYYMQYSQGLYIDAENKGNLARFVNHSCNANCKIVKWNVNGYERIGFVAEKNIEKGTEITVDYGNIWSSADTCFCGEKNCRGSIGK